ncbi:PEP-CTERM sorting domain-containing protein [Geminocystis sp. GBBB08]|uniref:PEP-CTERM sorting domain-containing protein n=1 Tax=Geminocystis sp. GBBB08 TaxID=2604140 RepID=UPI0027E2262C|nr:PEP-CTERM sorting domain-containing protein [Geminocystis sp. GBBB08]MBL1211374.1 PEP-CTERM sorting domain-containing protein [Geminocystis sp. GBBB08]
MNYTFYFTSYGTGPFASGGGVINNRVWNGTVIYDLNVAEQVPEPVTILGSLVALGIGSAMKRKISNKNI